VNTSRQNDIDDECKVIIAIYDDECTTELLRISDSLFEHFELRVIGCGSDAGEGEIFARHNNNFRFQKIIQKGQAGCNCSESDTAIINHLQITWRYMIFVQKAGKSFKAMRDTLLELQGGQSKVVCKKHEYPLISVPRSKLSMHVCCLDDCDAKCFARCPGYKCMQEMGSTQLTFPPPWISETPSQHPNLVSPSLSMYSTQSYHSMSV
jgi:hypothetical protein